MEVDGEPIIAVANLVVDYSTADGPVHAVDSGFSLTLRRGELLGLRRRIRYREIYPHQRHHPAAPLAGGGHLRLKVTYHRSEDRPEKEVDLLHLPVRAAASTALDRDLHRLPERDERASRIRSRA